MKLKLTSFIIPAFAAASIGFSGCSLLEKTGVVKQSGAEGTVTETDASPAASVKPLVPPAKMRMKIFNLKGQ